MLIAQYRSEMMISVAPRSRHYRANATKEVAHNIIGSIFISAKKALLIHLSVRGVSAGALSITA
jgi:hypothetical protein